jgi:hypothetical protein
LDVTAEVAYRKLKGSGAREFAILLCDGIEHERAGAGCSGTDNTASSGVGLCRWYGCQSGREDYGPND